MTDFWTEMQRVRRQLDRVEAKVNTLLRGQRLQTHLEELEIEMDANLQAKFDQASEAINAQTSVEDGNRTLLQHLVQMITDIKNNTTDPAEIAQKLDELVAGIQQNTDTLSADVTANTPAENV